MNMSQFENQVEIVENNGQEYLNVSKSVAGTGGRSKSAPNYTSKENEVIINTLKQQGQLNIGKLDLKTFKNVAEEVSSKLQITRTPDTYHSNWKEMKSWRIISKRNND